MRRVIFLALICILAIGAQAQKAENWSNATATSVKTRIGAISQSEADARYPQIADGDPTPIAPLDSPQLTGVPTAPTALLGTNTTQVATTAFVTNKLNLSDINNTLNLLTRKNYLLPLAATTMTNALTSAMIDGYEYITTYRAIKPITVDTIQFFLSTSTASYTADNYNGICLYSISGGVDNPTFTKVTQITDTPDMWKAAANTLQTFVFPVATVFNPGDYFAIGYVWNASTPTTAPIMLCIGSISINLSQITTTANLRLQTARSGRSTLDEAPTYSLYSDQLGIPYILIK